LESSFLLGAWSKEEEEEEEEEDHWELDLRRGSTTFIYLLYIYSFFLCKGLDCFLSNL
jgi:hypothetical protein